MRAGWFVEVEQSRSGDRHQSPGNAASKEGVHDGGHKWVSQGVSIFWGDALWRAFCTLRILPAVPQQRCQRPRPDSWTCR
jgi:hypothetical protein